MGATNTIPVTRHGTACPVSPCPATPAVQSRLSEEIRRQANISLAKIKLNPVPKGNTYDRST